MTHALTPDTGKSWWSRLLTIEPAIVKGVIGALVALGLIWGVDLTPLGDQLTQTADILGSLVAILTPVWIRQSVTPDAKVVQTVEPDGRIVAGPASPAPTGSTLGYVAGEVETEDGRTYSGALPYDGDDPA